MTSKSHDLAGLGWVRHAAWSLILTLLSVAGVLCIALVIAGYAFGMSLVMFSTGSMAPTIPAGSVALVREVPATEIEVGDVVTVARPDDLPITHRVLEVLAVDGETVTFTMQGDANDDPDLQPYTATTVREVLGSVPRIATLVASLQDARVLGGLAVGAAALVTWAFWPRHEEDEPPPKPAAAAGATPSRAAPSRAAPADAVSPVAAEARTPAHAGPRRRDLRTRG